MNIQNSKLAEINQTIHDKVSDQETGTVKPQTKLLEAAGELKALIAGEIFQGEITDISNSVVSIRLENGQSIMAKLAEPMELYVNQILSFQVKSNQGNQIEIKPLFDEFLQLPTLKKALDAANLNVNDKNLEMVKSLMDAGLPIDRQSILNVNKLVLKFPETDIKTIVQLSKLEIPITREAIIQFENYKNQKHQITNEINMAAEEISVILEKLIADGNVNEGIAIHKEILSIFSNPETVNDISAKGKENETGIIKEQEEPEEAKIPKEPGKPELPVNTVKTNNAMGIRDGKEEVMGELQLKALVNDISYNTEQAEPVQGEKAVNLLMKAPDLIIMSEEREGFLKELESFGLPEEITRAVKSGTLTENELLHHIKLLIDTGKMKNEDVIKLFSSKEYQVILKEGIKSEWLLPPEDVAKDTVEKLYKKLVSQNNELQQVFSNMNRDGTVLTEHSGNLKSNVDFMNQLNQILTYIQIPLKLKNQVVHSELFVYTNKKNLKKKGGNLSVLLHLDMEHLGSTDVYLNLTGKNINIKFYFEDEDSVRITKDNMEGLNTRIEQLGYNCMASVEGRKTKENTMEEFLGIGNPESNIKRYTFDVRM